MTSAAHPLATLRRRGIGWPLALWTRSLREFLFYLMLAAIAAGAILLGYELRPLVHRPSCEPSATRVCGFEGTER